MGGRIENLGDYNKARIMLQKRGGDLFALIKDIKNVGAREALPKHVSVALLIGAAIGAAIGAGGTFAAHKISAHVKTRRELRDKELEEKLKTVLSDEDETDKPESEESPC